MGHQSVLYWYLVENTQHETTQFGCAIQDFKHIDNFNHSRWTKLSCVILLQNCFSHAPVSISWCECSEIFQTQKAEQLITPQYLLTVVHICIIYIYIRIVNRHGCFFYIFIMYPCPSIWVLSATTRSHVSHMFLPRYVYWFMLPK